ncbi:MAG: GntR family transcriptional regulator [Oscillospiraceae bacterium]|jgi:DNA-binding transcriptional regulator YhcF (GntR family)|nr:GntR family transcriptional regulator [Oscillospiraceae bacterium]
MKSALDGSGPIFLQIKESIEEDILYGRLGPDEQIPSNSQLVSFYNINPVTVLKGVNLLAEEGLIYKKRGMGMFVSPEAPGILRKRFREALENGQLQALVRLAKILGLGRQELRDMIDKLWEEK